MTNNRFYRMNIVNDNLFSLCKHDVETMNHLLGQNFQKWWKQVTGNKINLNYKSIVFGVNPQNPDMLLNLIIIIKRMIYICKFSTIQVPSMMYFKKLLNFNYDLEKQISVTSKTHYQMEAY